MNILDAIVQARGGGAVRQLGSQFGLSADQTQSALSALVPALAGGLQKNMSSPGGAEGLLSALSKGGHQRYLEDPAALAQPATTADGNGILGHVFGSKDVSRDVAARAAASTGIDASILKQMLPLVAALAMGGLSKQARPSAAGASSPAAAGGLMAMLTPMLDQNRDGSVVDDVLGMAGRMFGGQKPGR